MHYLITLFVCLFEFTQESLGRQKAPAEKVQITSKQNIFPSFCSHLSHIWLTSFSQVNPPRLLLYKPWEYCEDLEELGVQQVFSEVGEVMKYVKTLRGEVRKLHATIRALNHVQAPPPAAASGGATGTGTGPASPNKAPRGALFAADANKDGGNNGPNGSSSGNGNTTAVVTAKAGTKANSAEELKTNTTSASAAVTSSTAEPISTM